MKKLLDILKVVFSTLLIILIINLTGVIVIDTVFDMKTAVTNNSTDIPEVTEDSYSTEMKDIGELFGFTEEVDIPIDVFDDNLPDGTPKIGTTAVFNTNTPENGAQTASGNSGYDTAAANAIYNKYYGILAGMQGSYQSRAEGIVASAKAEYIDAVNAGEDSEEAKSRIYSKYISPLSDLMAECDGAVEGVLSQMSAELASIGADSSYVNQLRGIYGSIVSGYSSSLQ